MQTRATLGDIRRRKQLTLASLAKRARRNISTLHRTETSENPEIKSLRRYLTAMGYRLALFAVNTNDTNDRHLLKLPGDGT